MDGRRHVERRAARRRVRVPLRDRFESRVGLHSGRDRSRDGDAPGRVAPLRRHRLLPLRQLLLRLRFLPPPLTVGRRRVSCARAVAHVVVVRRRSPRGPTSTAGAGAGAGARVRAIGGGVAASPTPARLVAVARRAAVGSLASGEVCEEVGPCRAPLEKLVVVEVHLLLDFVDDLEVVLETAGRRRDLRHQSVDPVGVLQRVHVLRVQVGELEEGMRKVVVRQVILAAGVVLPVVVQAFHAVLRVEVVLIRL
mmetsp:Transcript_3763/g.9755  ORF Transcript_3763/g.9755 Transcript_3763/m.9755 type:complete len:252 (+) Transcript_3763:1321-2076(+)